MNAAPPTPAPPLAPAALERVLTRAAGAAFLPGNTIERLRNGDEIFPAMLDAIAAARHEIAFLTFVYWEGEIARRFAAALADAACRGVTVRVLLDAFGSLPMHADVLQMMERAGVTARKFRPLRRLKVWQNNNRTHRKVLVCDRAVAFTGGVGIAEEWSGDARREGEWRDTHFRLRGPVTDSLWAAFASNWVESLPAAAGVAGPADRGEAIEHDIPSAVDRMIASDPIATPPPAGGRGVAIQTVASTASVRWSEAFMVLATTVRLSRQTLNLTTAYFVPGVAQSALLADAVARGVRVRVLVPGPHTDKRIARYASQDAFGPLLRAGVEIYCFQPSMLHAKVLVIDGRVTVIGSANFNQRSMQKDDEVCLTVIDEPLAATLDADFEADLARSERIDPERWRRRPMYRRLLERLTRVVRPEL